MEVKAAKVNKHVQHVAHATALFDALLSVAVKSKKTVLYGYLYESLLLCLGDYFISKVPESVFKMIAHSQLAALPDELPFRIVSKTIGQGAYAWYVLNLNIYAMAAYQ